LRTLFYTILGYGLAKVNELSKQGVQLGFGSKYELANGVGLFVDYINFYSGDNFDGSKSKDSFFSATNIGATYSF